MSTIIEYPELKETQGKIDERQTKLATIFAEAGPEFDMAKVKSLDGDSTAKVAAGARKPKAGLAPGLMSSAAQGEVYHGAKVRLHNASR